MTSFSSLSTIFQFEYMTNYSLVLKSYSKFANSKIYYLDLNPKPINAKAQQSTAQGIFRRQSRRV